MKTIAHLKREAARHGAMVVKTGSCDQRRTEYQVEAPAGFLWGGCDCHALCLGWWTDANGRPTWPEEKVGAIEDAIERMAEGPTACDDPECDWCHPEPESCPEK